MRFRNTVHRQVLTDEFGYSFEIAVPVTVTDFWMDGQWEETINAAEFRKVEEAIEKRYPGWYHRCYPDRNGKRKVSKEDCPACRRKKSLK